MAIANKIMPNALRKICKPVTPKSFSSLSQFFKTAYTNNVLMIIPIIIFWVAYSALSDKRVVMVPAPAINGKAKGTMDRVEGSSSLKNVTPSIISIAIKNITSEPAMANEEISKPIIFNKPSPENKKTTISTNDTKEAFSDSIFPALVLKSSIIGIAPSISIMANNIMVTDIICDRLKKVFIPKK